MTATTIDRTTDQTGEFVPPVAPMNGAHAPHRGYVQTGGLKYSPTVGHIAAAFVDAQAEIGAAAKDKSNPHFNSRYADLASVMDACKGALNAKGIAIIQTPVGHEPNRIVLETRLIHRSGEWMAGELSMPLPRADPQAYGSALTYARRYHLASIAGVCPDDDDGEGAMNRNPAPRQQQRPPAQRPPAQGRSAATPAPAQKSDAAPAKPQQPPPAAPEGDDMSDDATFQGAIADAARARRMSEGYADSMLSAVCRKKKVKSIVDLSLEDRHALIAHIDAGDMDPPPVNSPPPSATGADGIPKDRAGSPFTGERPTIESEKAAGNIPF